MGRKSTQSRKTRETEVKVSLNIDGEGRTSINTGVKFLDHMLELFTFFAIFDLDIEAKGDLDVDIHHTNEDIGITLGKALKEALGEAKGIKRFGYALVPMEECLVRVVVDICGRPSFSYAEKNNMPSEIPIIHNQEKTKFIDEIGEYRVDYAEHLLESFVTKSGINLTIGLIKGGQNTHHVLEAIFKALGLALNMACSIEPRRKGISSIKGVIDL